MHGVSTFHLDESRKYVAAMCGDCQQCQRGKDHKQQAAPIHPILVAANRFSQVHMDLGGPPPASLEGQVYLLTAIDRSTKWVEAVPLHNMEAIRYTDTVLAI
jgi:hypothetical protein